MTATTLLDDEQLRAEIRAPFETLGLRPIDSIAALGAERPQLQRRGALPPPAGSVELLSLVRDANSVLRWEPGLGLFAVEDSPRRAGRAGLPPGHVVQQYGYEQIAPNEVVSALDSLDRWLTPKRGLRRILSDGTLVDFPDGSLAAGKRVLLFIHGTFSNCDNCLDEILRCEGNAGRELIAHAVAKYDCVLTFDHPTVGVSPMLNAFDLAALLRPLPAEIDIVCHSRGGLVARWFLEGFASDALRQKARAIMVGATIGGTSLASPRQLKSTMDYLANVGDAFGKFMKLGGAHPFLIAAGIMMKVLTSVTRFAAKTPTFDAAIAIVPGLHGQSRIGNSPELLRLFRNTGASFPQSGLRYYAVTANFEPRDPGWHFLQYFSKPMQRMKDWAADIIFPGENDLVADCVSMTHIADNVEIGDVLRFETTDTVHHTNYFRQPQTLRFVSDRLQI